jgi:hypothetical protein
LQQRRRKIAQRLLEMPSADQQSICAVLFDVRRGFLCQGESMKRVTALLIVSSCATGFVAWAVSSGFDLSINNKTYTARAIVQNSKTYIPLEALQKAGVKAVISKAAVKLELPGFVGGANQRASLEGCLGETLFNGVWRVKTIKLEPIKKDQATPGWGLTLEVRNGSPTTIMPVDAGFDGTGNGIQLAFADASTINVDPYDVQKLTFASMPAGGAVTHQLKFYFPLGTSNPPTPSKFLLEVNSSRLGDSTRAKGVAFNTPNPSLRVRLDCQK